LTVTEQNADEDPRESDRPDSDRPNNDVSIVSGAHRDQNEPDRSSKDILILWPDRPKASSSNDDHFESSHYVRAEKPSSKRFSAIAAAMIGLIFGAAGGTGATIALGHMEAFEPANLNAQASTGETALLRETVARITADISGLRADLDHTGKTRTAQIGKLGDRLEKLEKFQDDTATKLAKIDETQDRQDKLHTASIAAAPETTGSIASPGAGRPDTKVELKRSAIVGDWTLQRVGGGGAIVEGPSGAFEAYPGDPLPGLGRVDAVRYQDGRWVVVTPKGLIVRR
jgi:hypothetical protein